MNESREITGVVLAAGQSTRMSAAGIKQSKLALELAGKPVIKYVTDTLIKSGIKRNIIIVGYQADEIKQVLGNGFEFVIQKERLGTGHALMQVRDYLKNYTGDLFVVVGDSPFLTTEVINTLVNKHRLSGAAATILTACYDKPPDYGRIIRDKNGKLVKVVEVKDASKDELAIKEVHTSHYCFRAEVVLPLLSEIKNNNAKKEYYLTDIIEILLKHNHLVETVRADDPVVGMAINTMEDFVEAEKAMKRFTS
ncbi:MAG: NTP transferase domain-containing protein [bacterium]|nr:NTP transferase domain-containing protein [bacterium]